MDEFDVIAAELLASDRYEQEEQAREVLAAGDEQIAFAEVLRRVGVGEVVCVTLLDGTMLRGRINRVGIDWCRVTEVADELGTARVRSRRVHEVRLASVSRLSRETGQ